MRRNFFIPLRFACSAFALCAVALNLPAANAGPFYVDTGIGAGQFRSAEAFFANTSPSSANGTGLAANVFVANILNEGFVEFHLGLKGFYNSAGSNSSMIAYPALRIDLSRIYFGGGYTPYVYKTEGALQRASSAQAGFVEAGLLWRVVPFFHLALEASAQVVKMGTGDLSPKPIVSGTFQMRFFVDYDGSSSGSKRAHRKLDGWRYPFGLEL